jgi:hypothetical protein
MCFQHSKWMPINADRCVTSRGYPGPLFSIFLYHYQVKGNWIVGRHGLLCKSVVLFLAGSDLCEFHTEQWGERCSVPVGCLPHAFLQSIVCRSAVHCLKSWRAALLSQDLRREGAFARTHTSIVTITSPIRFLFLAGSDLSEFHTKQWGERCSVPVGCLPHVILQSIVCRSAVHCLKSRRAALLLQDLRWEGAFARTHTSIVAITSLIHLLYWLGTCVNFIPNSEGSVALFLSVVCPTLFCNR